MHRRISWSAVFAGAIVAISLQFLLGLLGISIGLATVDPVTEQQPLYGLGVFSVIWWVLSAIVALFFGGWVAAWMANEPRKLDGAIHGAVAWGVYLVLALVLMGTALGSVIGGAMSLVSAGIRATGQVAGTAVQATGQIVQRTDLSPVVEQIRQEVDQMMAEGQQQRMGEAQRAADAAEQQQQQQQAQMEINRILDQVLQEGEQGIDRIDEQGLARLISQRTGMSEEQALERVRNWKQQLRQATQQAEQTWQEVGQQAEEFAGSAASFTASAAWWSFFILTLAVAAALVGGALGSAKVPEEEGVHYREPSHHHGEGPHHRPGEGPHHTT